MLQRDKTLTAVIWSRSPNFHTSQTLTPFNKREDDIYTGQFSPSLHHVWSFSGLEIFFSAGSLTLPVVCLYSAPFYSCSAATSLHTQSNLHPSDKHTGCYITVWSAGICRRLLNVFPFPLTHGEDTYVFAVHTACQSDFKLCKILFKKWVLYIW